MGGGQIGVRNDLDDRDGRGRDRSRWLKPDRARGVDPGGRCTIDHSLIDHSRVDHSSIERPSIDLAGSPWIDAGRCSGLGTPTGAVEDGGDDFLSDLARGVDELRVRHHRVMRVQEHLARPDMDHLERDDRRRPDAADVSRGDVVGPKASGDRGHAAGVVGTRGDLLLGLQVQHRLHIGASHDLKALRLLQGAQHDLLEGGQLLRRQASSRLERQHCEDREGVGVARMGSARRFRFPVEAVTPSAQPAASLSDSEPDSSNGLTRSNGTS